MISFNKGIYIVNGACKDCLYDVNTGKYYQILKKDTCDIYYCINNNKRLKTQFINKLFDLEILVDSNIDDYNDGSIKNIKIMSNKIKMAWIEVTNKCNLYCKHCYEESSSNCTKQMSYDTLVYVVDELLDVGVDNIQFIGGEPLVLNSELIKMIKYCVGKFKFIEVFTNGTLLTRELVRFFKDNDIKIALSVYSYNSFVHDMVTRVKGSHNRTIESIKLLKEYDVSYRLATVHMKDVFLGEKRFDYIDLNPNKDIARMSGRAGLDLLTPSLLTKKLITEDRFKTTISKKVFSSNLSYHNCFSQKIYISSELEVYPCVMERRISHGNIKHKKLSEVLNDTVFCLNKDKINECKDCEFRYACHDCRADRISEEPLDKPWYCTYNPYLGVWTPVEEFIAQFTLNNDNYVLADIFKKLKGYDLLDVIEVLKFYFTCDEIKITYKVCSSDNPFSLEDIQSFRYSGEISNVFSHKKVIDIIIDSQCKNFEVIIEM